MIIGFNKKASRKRAGRIAFCLALLFIAEIVTPTAAFALSGGPSQPEFAGFAQASATDMVDLFTGDFKYNLPLFDIDGYPVNLSYNAGPGMEQEASWVGLGWTLNPGMVSRSVRGIPDDFNGELVKEQFKTKKQRAISLGQAAAGELVGFELGAGLSLDYHSEAGFSIGTEGSIGTNFGPINAGVSASSSTESGLTLTPYASTSAGKNVPGASASVSIGMSASYNSRNGWQNIGVTAGLKAQGEGIPSVNTPFQMGFPIGAASYFPNQTPQTETSIESIDIKVGAGAYANDFSKSYKAQVKKVETITDEKDLASYGYLYHQNAPDNAKTDFNRDADAGHFTSEMDFLPPSALMPDIYTIQGQGLSGAIRPYRMETSAFSDPKEFSMPTQSVSGGIEINPGSTIDFGGDFTDYFAESENKAWTPIHSAYKAYKQEDAYQGQPVNSLEQNLLYFKTGEIRPVNNYYYNGTGNNDPDFGADNVRQFALSDHETLELTYTSLLPEKHNFPANDPILRLNRSEHVQFRTAKEATAIGGTIPKVNRYQMLVRDQTTDDISYQALDPTDSYDYPSTSPNSNLGQEDYAISEIISYATDGSRYVFGIPVINNSFGQKTFSIDKANINEADGITGYTSTEASTGNEIADEYYYGKSYGKHTHSYLLTSYLGTDYVDVTSNGVTEDDLGTAVRFNWSMDANEFKWRLPITEEYKADHDIGRLLDETDDKGSYSFGTRNNWYIQSIESKNHIAFFILGDRMDGYGADENSVLNSAAPLKKLEEIRIYTRDEWEKYESSSGAESPVAVKTIEFIYDYSQCRNVPNFLLDDPLEIDKHLTEEFYNEFDENQLHAQTGKLTLRRVIIKNGTSDKGALSPYIFDYQSHGNGDPIYDENDVLIPNAEGDADLNPDYQRLSVDRWGFFKGANPNNVSRPQDYPYVNEIANHENDKWASAWCLSKITLPSGANIEVTYEADSYAKVQDRKAQVMLQVKGIGTDSECSSPGTKLHKGSRTSSLNLMSLYVDNPFDNFLASDFYDLEDPESWLYFRCKVKLPGKDGGSENSNSVYEDIRGYAKVSEIELCDANTLRLKLKSVAFDEDGSVVNPILKAALDYTYINYQGLLYGGINPNSGSVENTIKNMSAIVDDLMSMFNGPYNHMIDKGIAKEILPNESYVRLNHPGNKRIGGGHRVAKIELNDQWAGGENSTYGQRYYYEDSETGATYGVASYEPMQGNDENPFKKPHFYSTDDSNAKKPKPMVYQEEPFGELFLPSAVVGYSKVIVEPLKFTTSKSSGQYTEHEFYTANDFPFSIDIGKLDKEHKLDNSTFAALGYGSSESFATTSQGYVYKLNDMHGKPRSETTTYKESGYSEEPLKRTEYIYLTNPDGTLSNQVEAIDRNGEITDVTLGLDVDLNIDSRHIDQKTTANTYQVNVKHFMAGPAPIFLPPFLPKQKITKLQYRTVVVTKQIMQKGILKSINYKDGNLQTVLTNELYDAETGQVVKTSQSSNYAGLSQPDLQWEVNYPAYFAEDRMGHAYRNDGFVGKIGKEQPFMDSDTYNDVVKLSSASQELMASMIYRGFLDGMDWVNWGQGNEKYFDLSGNLVPEGVFVEGDEVLVVDDNAEFGDRYHVAEVLTADELAALLALNPDPPANDLSGWPPPTSGGGNTPTTYNGGTVPSVLCNGEAISHAVIEDIFNRVITLSGATYDYGMVPIYYQSTGTHYAAVRDYLEAHDALRFYDIWTPTGSYQEDYYNLVSQLLMDPQARDFLAYLDDWGQDNTLSQATPSENEGIRMQALLYILQCNEMRTCLVEACGNSSIVQVLEGLFQFQDGDYPVHGLLAIAMAANWDNHYIAFKETAGSQDAGCDFQNNVHFNSGYDYTLKTYSDFFGEANDEIVLNGGYYSNTELASNPSFANGNATNYTQQVYSMVNGTYSSANSFGVVNLSCEAVGYDPTWSLNHYSCDENVTEDPGTYNDPDPNDENPNQDPDPPVYNTPTIGEVAMFINADGEIKDLDGKMVKIIRSGRRNMLSAQVGSESYVSSKYHETSPSDPKMVTASAMHYKDEWATDFFTDGEANSRFNAFLTGHRGIFRPHLSYQPNGDRYYHDERNALKDGLIEDYSAYWSYYDEGGGNYVYNRIVPNTNAENEHWVLTEEFTNYSGTGAAVESKNALDIYSTLIQSRNNHMLSEGVNVSHRQILVEDFEGYNEANGMVISHGISGAAELVTGTGEYLIQTDAHSGEWCLALQGSASSSNSIYDDLPTAVSWTWNDLLPATDEYNEDFYRIRGFAPSGSDHAGTYTLSFWAKSAHYVDPDGVSFSPAFDPAETLVSAQILVSTGSTTNTSVVATPTGQMIDGWQRMQVEFDIAATSDKLIISLTPGAFGCMVDDLRIYPSEGKILTYVYDKTYRRLAASLNENNLATFFKYDQDGALMKTERETENGRLTIKEQYKSSRLTE